MDQQFLNKYGSHSSNQVIVQLLHKTTIQRHNLTELIQFSSFLAFQRSAKLLR